MADYDKTRGDSVFIDNSNRVMEINNLQEELTPTEYNGQKASVLDGTSQYWSKALPTNLLTNGTFETGVNTDGWTLFGTITFNDTETGKTGNYCAKIVATGVQGLFKVGLLTVGKKYKLTVRYKGTVGLSIGRNGSSNQYGSYPATSQWNTVVCTFTSNTNSDFLLYTSAAGTLWIDDISITEDWKLDLNESHELIKHSINRDFEQTLSTIYSTDFSSSTGWTLTDSSVTGNQLVVNKASSGDIAKRDLGSSPIGKKYIIKFDVTEYTSGQVTVLIGGYGHGIPNITSVGNYSYETMVTNSSSNNFFYFYTGYASGFVGKIDNLAIYEIPNLVTNGTFTGGSTGWSLGTDWAYGSDKVTKTAGTASTVSQAIQSVSGKRYRISFEVKDYSAGSVYALAYGNQVSPAITANGVFTVDVIAGSTNTNYGVYCDATFAGSIDNIHIYEISDYAPSVNAQVSGNNHYCQISSIDKQGTTGTQSLRITGGGAGRGAEVLTNGDITGSATGWTINGTTCQYGTNNFICSNVDNSSACNNNVDLVIGKTYEVIYTITRTAGSIKVRLGTGNTGTARTESGTYREVQICATTTKLVFDGTNFYGTIESVSVKEVLGEVSLPSAQINPLVAGNKYTKEFGAKVDPASLSYGSDLASGWDFTSGWATVSGTVVDSNSFLTAGEGGIRKDFGSNGAKIYKCRIAGTTTASTMRIMDYGISTTYYGSSVTGVSGTFDVTFYFSAISKGLHFRNNGAGQTDITTFELYEATPITLTAQLGTKSVTSSALSIVAGTFTKFVLNFEATASEVNQDLKLYLSGAGSVFVDAISLTQAYDMVRLSSFKTGVLGNTLESTIFMNGGVGAPNVGGIWSYVSNPDRVFRASIQDTEYKTSTSFATPVSLFLDNSRYSVCEYYDKVNTSHIYVDNISRVSTTNLRIIGKVINNATDYPLRIGTWATSATVKFKGSISPMQIIRFDNISQSNFNPQTYKIGDAITGGGAEVVLWQDWSNITGAIANDKYRPETTVRNDLTAYGSPLASTNIVTVKDFSPQTKKLRQGTQGKQPIYSSVTGFDFDGTDDILEATSSLGTIKTVVLKLKADNIELGQDILQLSAGAKLVLNVDGTITATGFTSPTIKIQNTLLADAVITANNDFLVCVKTATAITADAFKLGGSTTFFNGKIRRVSLFTTELDDPTIQKIFKSIRSI